MDEYGGRGSGKELGILGGWSGKELGILEDYIPLDFWVWINKFGSCLGGSHPLINTPYKRSTSLYTVLKAMVVEETRSDLSLSCTEVTTEVFSSEVEENEQQSEDSDFWDKEI